MPELRKDPFSDVWVIFSPERLRRPQHYKIHVEDAANYSPFLEGKEEMTPPEVYAVRKPGSLSNGPGWKVRVVPNRYPALRVEGNLHAEGVGLYDLLNGIGAHEVIIETPDPQLSLEDQPLEDMYHILEAFKLRMQDLSRDPRLRYILIFKNHGALAGASIPHPHSQLTALPIIPTIAQKKLQVAQSYFETKERNLFSDILQQELRSKERIIYENNGFVVLCPYASRVPFETLIMPKWQSHDYRNCDAHQLLQLADALKVTLQRLNISLDHPSYNLMLHSAPLRCSLPHMEQIFETAFRWHIEILPRLSQYAGFELGSGSFINFVLPEEAASHLRKARLTSSKKGKEPSS